MRIANPQKKKQVLRARRHARVRAKVVGTAERPRLSVFRSMRHFSAQIINDDMSVTVAAASDRDVKVEKIKGKTHVAEAVGTLLAERAQKASVSQVVFDRGGYAYHGRVKAFAEAARAGGLIF